MSTLKDQFQRARGVLDSLVKGAHPKTGDDLPENSVVNETEVIRALSTAVLALDQMSARLARRVQLPDRVGDAWTEKEEKQLRNEFCGPGSIPDIAIKHGRTIRAIEARLERLGLLAPDQRTMGRPSGLVKRQGDDE